MRVLERRGKADLAQKAICTEDGAQLWAEYLERDGTVVLEVSGQVDHRHPTAAELALERVAVGQGGLEPLEGLWQRTCRTGVPVGYSLGS